MGTKELPSLVPAEYCKILSSPMKVKLNAIQSDKMIQFACRPPGNNYKSIMEQGRTLLRHEDPELVCPVPSGPSPLIADIRLTSL